MNNPSQFFYAHFSTDIQKKSLYDQEKSLQKLKFLIIIMQILYLFNIRWITSNLSINQTHIVKDIGIICEGMLVLITITIYLICILRQELHFDNVDYPEHKHSK